MNSRRIDYSLCHRNPIIFWVDEHSSDREHESPTYISPSLWTTLHLFPAKAANHQDFFTRLQGVVSAARCSLTPYGKITSTFSVLLVVRNDSSERIKLKAVKTKDYHGNNSTFVGLSTE